MRKKYPFAPFKTIEPIKSDSILIWRNPKQHLISAIQTDYVWGNGGGNLNPSITKEWNLNKVIENMINNNSSHWSPNLYKNIYKIWNKTPFQFLELNKLSTLIYTNEVYSSKDYDSHNMPHFISKDEILKLIPNEKLLLLYSMCDKDELWLKRMLNNETGLVSYDDYNDLIEYIKHMKKNEYKII
jgi:hypothetical protein